MSGNKKACNFLQAPITISIAFKISLRAYALHSMLIE